jgi:hypothetical protein
MVIKKGLKIKFFISACAGMINIKNRVLLGLDFFAGLRQNQGVFIVKCSWFIAGKIERRRSYG